jgi:hypothetical protein
VASCLPRRDGPDQQLRPTIIIGDLLKHLLVGAPIQRLLCQVPTDTRGDPLVGRPIYSFTLLCTLYCFGLFETVQNLKFCSIWNLFRIWKFVSFEKMFKIWKFVPFENLFRISKIVPFEICSNLKNCSIWNQFRISNFVPFEICSEFETV